MARVENAFLARIEQRDLATIMQLCLQLPRIDMPDIVGHALLLPLFRGSSHSG